MLVKNSELGKISENLGGGVIFWLTASSYELYCVQ